MKNNPSLTARYTLAEWPHEYRENYFRQGLWNEETFGQCIHDIANARRDEIAICFNDEKRTYGQLCDRGIQLAARFREMNIDKGDVVILHLPNSINYVEALSAFFIAGIVPVFVLPAHRENEILAFTRAANAKAYFYQETFDGDSLKEVAQRLARALPDIQQISIAEGASLYETLSAELAPQRPLPDHHPDDLACFQLSGGTTGIPKLIPRRHRDYLCNIRAAIKACGFGPQTVYLTVLPMGHNFPLACPGFIGTMLAGGRVIISDKNYPDHCFDLIDQHRVTVTALVPPLAMVWLDAAEVYQPNLCSLEMLQVGGAKMSYEAAKRVRPVLGCSLQQVFGMAEGLICFTQPGDVSLRALTTQGRPMTSADEIRVVDELGEAVAPGEIGFLLTRGPYTIRGYYAPDEINAASFTEQGFYHSGDLVRLTLDGDIISEGRDKDQINRGGEKIDCGELEDILLRHPAVKDAAVVGIHDDYLGEQCCAFILYDSSAPSAMELRQFLTHQGVASFKIPDRFNFTTAFNLTGVGKVSKKQLRAKLKQDFLFDPEGK